MAGLWELFDAGKGAKRTQHASDYSAELDNYVRFMKRRYGTLGSRV